MTFFSLSNEIFRFILQFNELRENNSNPFKYFVAG